VEHLRQLFEKLNSAGLVVNAEKCMLAVRTVDFLGHRITADGVQPLSDHVEAILNFPPPATIKQLQAFLGIVYFYRRFAPGAANTLLPLTEFLKGSKSGSAAVDWSPEREAAFVAAKEKVAAATMLAHPVAGAELALVVDASDLHVGAVQQQREGPTAEWRPLGFFSKKLEPAQTRYSMFGRELYACFAAIRHFRYMLEGRQFCIFTDHKPLTFAVHRSSDPWTGCQARQLAYITKFTSDLKHISGKQNVVADTMSWPAAPQPQEPAAVAAVAATPAILDYAAIAECQDCAHGKVSA
jgi:RNase H-like domain found in reverse transcriptase